MDTKLTRLSDGKLDITVYRKKTHTDMYLYFESHHPTHVKKGTVRCLYYRPRNIMLRDKSLKEEEGHLMRTFIRNSYPRAFVHSAAVPHIPREPSDDSDDSDGKEASMKRPPVAFLPYVAGVSEKIRKCVRTSTSERCSRLDPLYETCSLNPSRSRSNQTTCMRYRAPTARCTLGKLNAG